MKLNSLIRGDKTHFPIQRFFTDFHFHFHCVEWKTYCKTLLKMLQESSYRILSKQHRLHTVRILGFSPEKKKINKHIAAQ